MFVIADLQLHSRFSRAVSPQMTIPNIAQWARQKGIGLVATGDWMHPIWFREIERDLEEIGNGLLKLRTSPVKADSRNLMPANSGNLPSIKTTLFLLATEISSIYSQGGKVRRVHTLIWVPTLESARKINTELTKRGCNLMSDGRPIVGLSCIHIAELVLSIEPKALIIPAHAWTPWFSVYGSMGGFNSLDEAFGPYAKHIYAIETGLSSNPSMNWRIKELDNRTILSFSDAHSGPKLGREATVFEVPDGELSYETIYQAIAGPADTFFGDAQQSKNFSLKGPSSSLNEVTPPKERNNLKDIKGRNFSAPQNGQPTRNLPKIAYTIEFYPEEGKYHYTGHRNCNIRWSPEETKKKGTTCPVCGKPLTQGVMQRVEELAGRSEESLELSVVNKQLVEKRETIQMISSKAFADRPPFVMVVPLVEIIAESIHAPVTSPKVHQPYDTLIESFGSEFGVLFDTPINDITHSVGDRIALGISKVRSGDIFIDPGYDGVFGKVKIWKEGEESELFDGSKEQLSIFT